MNAKRTPKSERTREQVSRVTVLETGNHDLGQLTNMREMFKEYDKKMSARITKIEEKFSGIYDELNR